MVVVAHVLAQRRAPVAVREYVLGPLDRQRPDGLDRRSRARTRAPDRSRRTARRRSPAAAPCTCASPPGKRPGDLRCALHHHVPTDLIGRVGEPAREAAARGVEQQARRLDRVAGDSDRVGALKVFSSVLVEVRDPGDPAGRLVELDPRRHAVSADLGAVRDRVRDVGDERRGLGVHLAALQAEPAVDAVRTVAERTVRDPDRSDPDLDPELPRARPGALRATRDRVRAMRVAVRIAPRPVLAGDRQLELEALVMALEIAVGDRPVGADAVSGRGSRSRTGESVGSSRRSGPSSRRRRARSCSCRAPPDRCRRSRGRPSSTAGASPPRRRPSPRSGSQNGPDSSTTTRQPRRASRCASVPPPAPAPTMTRSTG